MRYHGRGAKHGRTYKDPDTGKFVVYGSIAQRKTEQQRQLDEQHQRQLLAWQRERVDHDALGIVAVGQGSRWYVYGADAELFHAATREYFRTVDGGTAAASSLPVESADGGRPAWIATMLSLGRPVLLVRLAPVLGELRRTWAEHVAADGTIAILAPSRTD